MKKPKLAFPHYIYPTHLLLTPQLLVPVHAIMVFFKSILLITYVPFFMQIFQNHLPKKEIERKSDGMKKVNMQTVSSIPNSKG